MPRIRTIKPEFFDDEDLCALPVQVRLGFIGLWCQADKAGRLEDRPARLKARIFPFDDVEMDALLTALAERRFIVRYECGGRRYLAVRSWGKHQKPRTDEEESKLPPPPVKATDTDAYLRSDEGVTAETLGKERKGTGKGTGTEECAEAVNGSAPDALAAEPRGPVETREPDECDPVLLTFPTIGPDGRTWTLRQSQVLRWGEIYPGVDVVAEARSALGWLEANKGRLKTAAGMPRFLNGWIARDVNRGTVARLAEQPPVTPSTDDGWFAECKTLHAGKCGGSHKHATRMLLDRSRAS